MKIDKLRKKHSKLTYKSVDYNLSDTNLTISSHFTLSPDINFHPQVTIHGVSQEQFDSLSSKELTTYAFHIGMAEIFSYWKTAAPEEIVIEAGHLSKKQLKFWHDLLIKGMGEYFYVNKIDFTDKNFVKFSNLPQGKTSNFSSIDNTQDTHLNGTLIPLGGGKDSLVSLELLKKNYNEPLSLFSLNPTQSIKKIIKLNPELPFITATRLIDPKLIELNQKGYLNGHTPFSSYLAFLSVFVARIFKIKYIAISNERSSNEESVIYKDHPVNHQYSKSYQLEKNFQKYASNLLPSPQPFYFSLLRPLYELQIAKIFSEEKTYFKVFKSCNKNQKEDSWCCNCSKCLFAFIILYPFLDEKNMTDIFNINLLNNESLWSTTKELLGYSHQKPLDCVGTHEENLVALFMCYQKQSKDIKRLSKITKMFEKEILPHEDNLEKRSKVLLNSWNNEHSLPAQFDRIIKHVHQSTFKTK
jgi:UDP-N-acetyl-alpha-D-muramoyl-L-alanyl-L-glutamate epimerase